MGFSFIPIWKEAPFIRLTVPLMAGIVVEYFLAIEALCWYGTAALALAVMALLPRCRLSVQFRLSFFHGLSVTALLVSAGALLALLHDTSQVPKAIDRLIENRSLLTVTLLEPPAEKPRSYKVLGRLDLIQSAQAALVLAGRPAAGLPGSDVCASAGSYMVPETNIILYFRKDSTASPPGYGDRIVFLKHPQRITNIPNANGFDYVAHCAWQNIYFQAFLNVEDYVMLSEKETSVMSAMLFEVRRWVIEVLQQNVPGKKECGLAEALLIGYKNDLDKPLIQAYSATGVVHVIAISGLHLGLIYGLLRYLCLPLGKSKMSRWLSAVIIIAGLWMFSLLAGGSPSVLRSAVMFSFIVMGEAIERRTSLINNLAASAFFLLCYNPYWLWDIGFQLSYAALFSIAIFMKPIYHLLTIKNKILDAIWQLNAVTLAAQILTAPLCIFHFHQFPSLFLITNFIAVPLSSVILMGEILLCAVSFAGAVASPIGWLLSRLLTFMNTLIETIGGLPFSSFTGVDINIWQAVAMYAFIGGTGAWLLKGRKRGLMFALAAAILFMAMRFI